MLLVLKKANPLLGERKSKQRLMIERDHELQCTNTITCMVRLACGRESAWVSRYRYATHRCEILIVCNLHEEISIFCRPTFLMKLSTEY